MEIIAEVGSNWWHPNPKEGLRLCLSALWEARSAGATAVKFQFFRAESLYATSRTGLSAEEQGRLREIREKLVRFELPVAWLPVIKREARQAGLKLWASFFDLELLQELGPQVDVIKIASGDITYLELLHQAGRLAQLYNLRVCFSTGAALPDEIKRAAGVLGQYGKFLVMHCVSSYPARIEEMHLATIRELRELERCLGVGLSDHTLGHEAGWVAYALGAGYFEKHFRPSQASPESPDYGHSLDPRGFSGYVKALRVAQEMVGTSKWLSEQVSPSEQGERIWARRSPMDQRRPCV